MKVCACTQLLCYRQGVSQNQLLNGVELIFFLLDWLPIQSLNFSYSLPIDEGENRRIHTFSKDISTK